MRTYYPGVLVLDPSPDFNPLTCGMFYDPTPDPMAAIKFSSDMAVDLQSSPDMTGKVLMPVPVPWDDVLDPPLNLVPELSDTLLNIKAICMMEAVASMEEAGLTPEMIGEDAYSIMCQALTYDLLETLMKSLGF